MAANAEKDVLNLEEASGLLGVSTKTFIKALREEQIPARKIGREWRFSRTALLAWLGSGKSQAYSLAETEVREYFDSVAGEWDNIRKGYFDESVRDAALAKAPLGPDAVVADIGIGTGFMAEGLLKAGATVIGVDNSPEMLKRAGERFRSAGERLQLREGSVQALPLEDNAVDAAFGNMVLHHAPDPEAAIKEFARVVKPGGRVVITDMDAHNNTWMIDEMADIWLGFERADVQRWLEAAGLANVRVECSGVNCCADSSSVANAKVSISIFVASGTKPAPQAG